MLFPLSWTCTQTILHVPLATSFGTLRCPIHCPSPAGENAIGSPLVATGPTARALTLATPQISSLTVAVRLMVLTSTLLTTVGSMTSNDICGGVESHDCPLT